MELGIKVQKVYASTLKLKETWKQVKDDAQVLLKNENKSYSLKLYVV